MWIVRLALSRPYTFIVMALVIVLLTPVVLLRTPTDIFPEINIPVISLIWNYTGLEPQEMEQRITSNSERAVTTLVVLGGNSEQKEYVITSKLAVIGKSKLATVRLKGWFKPEVAAQINQRDDGYYIGPGDKTPLVNSKPIQGPVRLNDGDVIEVCGLRLSFMFRE